MLNCILVTDPLSVIIAPDGPAFIPSLCLKKRAHKALDKVNDVSLIARLRKHPRFLFFTNRQTFV